MRSLVLISGLALLGCGSGSGTRFLETAQAAAPAFAPAASTSQGLRGTIGRQRSSLLSGAAPNAMYNLLREYVFPRDEGKVNITNIYKMLHTVDDVGAMARSGCKPITEQAVPAPFDVGPGPTYTCLGNDEPSGGYRNGFALKDQGSVTHALLAFRWAPDPTQQRSLGQIQGHFDTSTQDVAFILVNLVEYPAGSTMGGASGDGFTVRTDLQGNAGTHTFTLRALVANVGGGFWTSLVGSGVSRGEGEHFLFRAWLGDSSAAGRYFCLPSTIDETGLGQLDPNGATEVPAECAHLASAVNALSPLVKDDAPLKASDFTGSDVGVSAPAP